MPATTPTAPIALIAAPRLLTRTPGPTTSASESQDSRDERRCLPTNLRFPPVCSEKPVCCSIESRTQLLWWYLVGFLTVLEKLKPFPLHEMLSGEQLNRPPQNGSRSQLSKFGTHSYKRSANKKGRNATSDGEHTRIKIGKTWRHQNAGESEHLKIKCDTMNATNSENKIQRQRNHFPDKKVQNREKDIGGTAGVLRISLNRWTATKSRVKQAGNTASKWDRCPKASQGVTMLIAENIPKNKGHSNVDGGLSTTREVNFGKASIWKGTFHETKRRIALWFHAMVVCSQKNKPSCNGKLNGSVWLFEWLRKSNLETISSTTRVGAEIGFGDVEVVVGDVVLAALKAKSRLYHKVDWGRATCRNCLLRRFDCFRQQPLLTLTLVLRRHHVRMWFGQTTLVFSRFYFNFKKIWDDEWSLGSSERQFINSRWTRR